MLAGSLFRTGGADADSYGSPHYRSIILDVFPDPDRDEDEELPPDYAITHCSSAQLAFIGAVVRSCSLKRTDMPALGTLYSLGCQE